MSLVRTSPAEELSELVENINAALNSIQKNSQHIMGWVHTIKTKELWRSTAAKTFSQFCEMNDWTPRRFNQLAAGYETLLTIPKEMGTIVPTESHLRELAKAPEKERESVVKETQKRDGKVTAKGIKQTVADAEYEMQEPKEMQEPAEPEVVRDETGVPIPPIPLAYWNRRQEVQDIMTGISKLKSALNKSKTNGDLLWSGVHQHLVASLETAYSYAKDAMPYSVCTVCQGWPETSKCTFCGMLGILPKWRYSTQGDDRVRAIREKQFAEFVSK